MQRETMCDHDVFFTAKHHSGQVAVMRQPAGCLTATLVTTLPLLEAVRACNALRRQARPPVDLPDRVLPVVPTNPLMHV